MAKGEPYVCSVEAGEEFHTLKYTEQHSHPYTGAAVAETGCTAHKALALQDPDPWFSLEDAQQREHTPSAAGMRHLQVTEDKVHIFQHDEPGSLEGLSSYTQHSSNAVWILKSSKAQEPQATHKLFYI